MTSMHNNILIMNDIMLDDTQEDIQVYLDDLADSMEDIILLESLIYLLLIETGLE